MADVCAACGRELPPIRRRRRGDEICRSCASSLGGVARAEAPRILLEKRANSSAAPARRADRVCAVEGCGRPLPRRGLLSGDPYCSTTCCRIAHGLEPAKPREYRSRTRRCKGCGCGIEEYTEGCPTCHGRSENRRRAGTKEAAA